MTKKNLFLVALVLCLGGLSLYLNRDRFRPDSIQIGQRWIPPRPWMVRRNPKPPSKVLIFLMDRKVQLTSVKVVPLADVRTNKYPHPIWELTTESNSVPVKEFVYGLPIRGMKPAVKGATADPLQPAMEYRLFVKAGSLATEYDFTTPEKLP
jgi:hypothetical protein